MKKTLYIFITTCLLSVFGTSTAKADSFFQLPIVPDTMSFNNRINYLVEHYWDFCDIKKAFSTKQKMSQAFKEYLDLMPLANSDIALASVNKFIKSVEKNPDNLYFIAGEAEEYMRSDSAVVISDVLYLPFATAVAKNKKIDKASKARFERQARLISNSMAGGKMTSFDYTDRDGVKRSFSADSADMVLLYIYDTDCTDCSLTRVRLDADIATNKLIEAGKLKIVAISPTEPDNDWKERVSNYPAKWIVGAAPDLDDIIEISEIPSFYILDNNHKIFGKNFSLEQALAVNAQMADNIPDPYLRRKAKEYRESRQSDTETAD